MRGMRDVLCHNGAVRLLVDCEPQQVPPYRDECIRLSGLNLSGWLCHDLIWGCSRACVRCRCGVCKSPQRCGDGHDDVSTITHIEPSQCLYPNTVYVIRFSRLQPIKLRFTREFPVLVTP